MDILIIAGIAFLIGLFVPSPIDNLIKAKIRNFLHRTADKIED